MIGEAGSYSDWVLMSLLHHPDFEELRKLADAENLELIDDGIKWGLTIEKPCEMLKINDEKPQIWTSKADKTLLKTIDNRINFQYSGEIATKIPNKLSVSDLLQRDSGDKFYFKRRPKVFTDQKLTATEKGNALHKFMQFTDYQSAKNDVSSEIERMRKDEFLSGKEIESLSVKSLEAFFSSALARRLFASEKIYRELRFITEFSKAQLEEIFPEIEEQNKVVLQGIADCVFIENEKAYILDYKTDRIKYIDELLERYRRQLEIYSEILKETLQMPIGGCILYSFELSDWIEF